MQNKTRRITIRKSVRPQLAEKIPVLIEDAINWMQAKYPSVDFSTTEFIFSASYRRSRYFRNEKLGSVYSAPNTCISTKDKMFLYDMKTLNISKLLTTKGKGLVVGSEIQIVRALIHELTHHAQYELNLPKGELETTRNELDYFKQHHPHFYHKMVNIS